MIAKVNRSEELLFSQWRTVIYVLDMNESLETCRVELTRSE